MKNNPEASNGGDGGSGIDFNMDDAPGFRGEAKQPTPEQTTQPDETIDEPTMPNPDAKTPEHPTLEAGERSPERAEKEKKLKLSERWKKWVTGLLESKLGRPNLIRNHNQREIDKLDVIVGQIEALSSEYEKLTPEELRAKTDEFRERLQSGKENLDSLLPEAYAAMREASSRVLHMKHFESQLRGGVALHQGRIAEMQTGEGKTLTELLPAYLNALSGKGVHIITANSYLAKRDQENMGRVFAYMGLSVGLVEDGMDKQARKAAYSADITYGTNSQFGFDYLRDNMATSPEDQVQRGHAFAIVDEADSILIDEARTPMVIAQPGGRPSPYFRAANRFVKGLREPRVFDSMEDEFDGDPSELDTDYIVDKKTGHVSLTEAGIARAEQAFGIENLADPENADIMHHILQAMRAHSVMQADRDYIVQTNAQGKKEIVLIDKNTGRPLPGRQYNGGLQGAIEAKEGLAISRENETQATITIKNFYRMYDKLSGMTGTGMTEEREFAESYGLDVVAIPTHEKSKRHDHDDEVYRTKAEKQQAILRQVQTCIEKKQPILIGTGSIENSEELSQLLREHGIPHNVLNAKNNAAEADIIAQAGRLGAVTIATNMAGRGTDIALGGSAEYAVQQQMRGECTAEELYEVTGNGEPSSERIKQLRKRYEELLKAEKKRTEEEKKQVEAAGGLFVLGTEHGQSRRTDGQLRGRAGRQGDTGESKFIVSFEDDLMRVFGSASVSRALETLPKGEAFTQSKVVQRLVGRVQKLVEYTLYQSRKREADYDDGIKVQRDTLFAERQQVLEGTDISATLNRMLGQAVENTVARETHPDGATTAMQPAQIYNTVMKSLFGNVVPMPPENLDTMTTEEFTAWVNTQAQERFSQNTAALGEHADKFQRGQLLEAVDSGWRDYLERMADLRRGVGFAAYAERDPVEEYRKEGYRMYDEMLAGVSQDVAVGLLKVRSAIQGGQMRRAA